MKPLRVAAALAARYSLDALALVGLGLIAYGLAQVPAPWGAVLGPLALGVGLLAAVRFGAR